MKHRKSPFNHAGTAGVIGSLIVLSSFSVVSAQSVNPATTIEQQNAQRLKELSVTSQYSGPVVISPEAARGAVAAPGGPTLVLDAVEFSPLSEFLTQADLDGILVNYVGKRVDFSLIQTLVQDVNDLYTEKGVVTASAVLPPQTLDRGVLKVQLVEGKLATASLSGNERVPAPFVMDRVRLTTGDENTVDVPTAAKDITRFNKVYGAQLRMSLQPGTDFGTTDLALQLTEPDRNQQSFFLDNQGAVSTGQIQAGFFFHRYSMLTAEDNFFLYGTLSEGSASGTLSYDLPVTPSGTRLSLSASRSVVEVIDGPTEPLNITGTSRSFNASLSHPLHFSPTWDVFASTGASYGESRSQSNATYLVNSDTTKYWLGFSATYTSENFAFSISPRVNFAKANDHLAPSVRDITLFTGTLNSTYQLDNGVALTANGAWQTTGTELLPGDLLFQVGGPATVRGYPSDTASGDSGYFVQLEAHKSVDFGPKAKGVDIYGFIDMGAVYSTFPEKVFLISSGAGMAYPLADYAKLELGVGIPLRDVVDRQDPLSIYGRVTIAAF